MISIIIFEHFVPFHYNTNPPPEQVFLRFIYKILLSIYEHLYSDPQFISLPEEVGEFLLNFVKRCSNRIKTIFRCLYFYGSAVYRTDCIQVPEQKEIRDFFLSAPQGIYCNSAYLSDAICLTYGNQRCVPC